MMCYRIFMIYIKGEFTGRLLHNSVILHCEVILFCCCEYTHVLYLSVLPGSALTSFPFATTAAIFALLHFTLSVVIAHLFRSLTPLVILSRAKMFEKLQLSLVYTLSLLDSLRQIVIHLPPMLH